MSEREPDQQIGEEATPDLETRLQGLEEQLNSRQETILRLMADIENIRRRQVEREALMRQDAVADCVGKLLKVRDNLARAVAAEGTDGLRDGVQLTLASFDAALTELNVRRLETVGQQFDPHLHEALGHDEHTDAEDGTVLEEYVPGYQIANQMIRPALVKVARRSDPA
jgi:molecular chaperone GrpE